MTDDDVVERFAARDVPDAQAIEATLRRGVEEWRAAKPGLRFHELLGWAGEELVLAGHDRDEVTDAKFRLALEWDRGQVGRRWTCRDHRNQSAPHCVEGERFDGRLGRYVVMEKFRDEERTRSAGRFAVLVDQLRAPVWTVAA